MLAELGSIPLGLLELRACLNCSCVWVGPLFVMCPYTEHEKIGGRAVLGLGLPQPPTPEARESSLFLLVMS